MGWPNDRRFVDGQGRILDSWMNPLNRLKRLTEITDDDITALINLARAVGGSGDDGSGDAFSLALPIDNNPLPDEDWFVGYKNSENAGRRYPMSLFEAAQPTLLSSASLSGNSSQDFVLPSEYNNFRFLLKGVSTAADAALQMRFSSDGGANFITCGYHLFDDGGDIAGPSTGTTPDISGTMTAASNYSHIIHIYDAQASARKLVPFHMINSAGSSAAGTVVVAGASPLPLNLVRFILSTSTFDAGTIDMWGIP